MINLIIKELIQVKRDPKLFRIVLIAPVLQLILLGYAATLDVENISVVVLDQDKTFASRQLNEKLTSSGYFNINYYTDNYDEIIELINKGKVFTALVIPKDFEKKINRRETVQLQIICDGSDGNKAGISVGYLQGIISSYTSKILMDVRDKYGLKTINAGSITSEVRVWYNPDLKTRNFMVPSVMALILVVTTTVMMAMGVVKEREIGTLEQLIVTPIKPFQLIIGKLIPFVIIGFIDFLIVVTVMVLWFGIAVRGDFLFLLFTSFIFIMSTLGLGLFISTISKTQQQAMMVAMFGILMPMIYLSGFAFPIENMPQLIQYITYAIPLRYYITILRGIILKGTGFSGLWLETLIMFLMGAGLLILSSLRFRRKLE
ncbi:MAG: ABC transporter permease [Ignavibacteriales bacterium]|nr:MAG: ABC transporter permease [Ignavibacteriales bacterium]